MDQKSPEFDQFVEFRRKKEANMIARNVISGYPNIRILGYPEHFAIQVSKY